jgi:hypothetical protein
VSDRVSDNVRTAAFRPLQLPTQSPRANRPAAAELKSVSITHCHFSISNSFRRSPAPSSFLHHRPLSVEMMLSALPRVIDKVAGDVRRWNEHSTINVERIRLPKERSAGRPGPRHVRLCRRFESSVHAVRIPGCCGPGRPALRSLGLMPHLLEALDLLASRCHFQDFVNGRAAPTPVTFVLHGCPY